MSVSRLSIHDWRKTASALGELGKWPLFWKRFVRVRAQVWRGGQPLHRNPHLYGALPTEGGKVSSSPRNLRPKGGRSPSHRKHYSQLQVWQPSSPGGALTCNPKVTCPFPQSPPETASHHQVERCSERLSHCSPTQGTVHQCPPDPPN